MNTLLAILYETEELFRVADKCPNSELSVIMWKISKACQLEEYYAMDVNQHWSTIYANLVDSAYNELSYYGYVPLDF